MIDSNGQHICVIKKMSVLALKSTSFYIHMYIQLPKCICSDTSRKAVLSLCNVNSFNKMLCYSKANFFKIFRIMCRNEERSTCARAYLAVAASTMSAEAKGAPLGRMNNSC